MIASVSADDGSGPRHVANERDLTEPVAPSELAQMTAPSRHFEHAIRDGVETISGIAFTDDT